MAPISLKNHEKKVVFFLPVAVSHLQLQVLGSGALGGWREVLVLPVDSRQLAVLLQVLILLLRL